MSRSRSGRFKPHGPRRHPPPDPPNQVRPPGPIPWYLDRRTWYVSYKRPKYHKAVPPGCAILFVIGLALMAVGEVEQWICIPVLVALTVIGSLFFYINNRKRK